MNSEFEGSGDEILNQALDAMGVYTLVFCGLKAFIEHNIELNLVPDKALEKEV